ncbi:hypothetical protein QFZ27_007578 [Inquilinus ginsengisoli]|uniref:YopT-type cysteine protease domain-containing protein n=1 Tax=Inquilinus ginsengisoli TaxID=363840 RepID=UPI003D263C39
MKSGPSDNRAVVIDYLVALGVLQSLPPPANDELSRLGSAAEPVPGGSESAPRHVFAGLRDHGRKVGKFKQRRSTGKLTVEAFDREGFGITQQALDRQNRIGYCVGISMKWAALQFAAPGLDAGQAAAEVEQREGDIHERNAQFVFDGALGKLKGLRSADYDDPLQAMLAEFGAERLPGDRLAGILHPPGDADPIPAATALAQACQDDDLLPPGGTVIAFLAVTRPGETERPGHVVSLRRDGDGTLRFFDPNAGEYAVDRPGPFFAAWIRSYREGRGAELEFDTSRIIDGFYRIGPLTPPPDDPDWESDSSESDEET